MGYAAFTSDPTGGNPAGVVLDASGLDETMMRAIAAEVGYSETAFVTSEANDTLAVRYFSPESGVPFCGHATIATAIAYAERHQADELRFDTSAGRVDVHVADSRDGPLATLTSVPPHLDNAADEDVAEALAALGWQPAELDPALPPRVTYAGARHLVLAAATRERLADLDYDFARSAAQAFYSSTYQSASRPASGSAAEQSRSTMSRREARSNSLPIGIRAKRWSIYGAKRAQPVATVGKWGDP